MKPVFPTDRDLNEEEAAWLDRYELAKEGFYKNLHNGNSVEQAITCTAETHGLPADDLRFYLENALVAHDLEFQREIVLLREAQSGAIRRKAEALVDRHMAGKNVDPLYCYSREFLRHFGTADQAEAKRFGNAHQGYLQRLADPHYQVPRS